MLNLRQLFNISQISYDNSLFELDFVCFNSSTKVDTCSTPIKFREGLEIKNLIITLEVRETTNFTEDKAYLPSQSIRLAENVSYYVDSTVSAAAVKQAYYSTSTASQAVQGIAIVSSSGSFSGFIKLTQAIEMVLYFNFNKPANFQSFLTFFSNNIFSLAYNPMADSIAQDCSLPAAFTDNGVSCSFLDNTGQLFLVFGVVGLLKLIVLGCLKLAQKHPRLLKGLQFANNALSLNLVLMLLDALMFDFLLAAMVALRSFSTASISSIINLLLAVATLGFYIFEIVFTFYYCRIMHVLKVQDQGPPNLSRQSSEEFKPQIAKTDNEFTKMKALPSSRVNIDDDKFKFEAARDFKPKPLISRLNITHYTEERNSEAITGRYFTAIDQSKLFVCCILVVSLFDYPFVQIGLIAACQTAVSFWYAFRRPHSSLKENFKCIMTEALLGCTMTLCILLVDGSGVLEAPADRFLYLGYPLIAISSLLFVTILIFNIYEAVQAIVSKIKKLSQKKVGVIYPVNKDLGKPENLIPIQYLKGDNHTLLENKSELSPTSSTSGSTKKIRVRKELKLALQSGNQSPTTKIKKIGPLLVSGGLKIKMNPP